MRKRWRVAAYRRTQPQTNELFRRPLCLAAWCSAFAETPERPPETLSEVMEAVLVEVLDDRVFRKPTGLPVTRASEVIVIKHQLGAVLAAYAEKGFGALCSSDDINVNPAAIDNPLDVDRWRELAVRAGLLIRADTRCYAIKIPVVEYLIGSYYAWLTQSAPDEDKDKSFAASDSL